MDVQQLVTYYQTQVFWGLFMPSVLNFYNSLDIGNVYCITCLTARLLAIRVAFIFLECRRIKSIVELQLQNFLDSNILKLRKIPFKSMRSNI
ncbi:hypothetical protein HI914_06396 [Erysiphe necator]|nr:hypothetical protein HI914_06396 [Erysiphe necator]